MKSDYYRYLAEYATDDAKGKATEDTCAAYAETTKIAEKDLVVNHPIHLAMALSSLDEVSIVAQRQTPIAQIVQKTIEIPQLHCIGNVIDIPVVEVVQVPEAHVAEKTVEIRQLDVVEKIVETPEIQPDHSIQGRIQQRTLVQIVDIPIPQVVAEAPKDFSQNRVQQSSMEQTIANPAISLAEETVEMPVIRTKEKTQHVVNTHVQQVVQQTVDIPSSTDSMTDSSRDAQMQVPTVQVAQKTVKEIRSKFEVEHTSEVHARNRSDKNRWREKRRFKAKQYPQDAQERADLMNQRQVLAIRSVQKTVEVPRVQYIDKVADIPVDVQRQEYTNQAPQHIDEVVDVPVPT